MTATRGARWPVWFVSAMLIALFGGLAVHNRIMGVEYASHELIQESAKSPSHKLAQGYTPKDRAEWRQEQDVLAQQSMARWTFWMFTVSIAGTIVAGLGLIFLKQTLDASLAANFQAMESTRVTRDMGMAQVRAYLTFEEAQFLIGDEVRVAFNIENCGQSPARGVMAKWVSCMIVLHGPGGMPARHFRTAYDEPMNAYLGNCKAGGSKPVSIPIRFTASETKQIEDSMRQMSGIITGAGLFRWTDVFDQEHTQPFALHIFCKPGQFRYAFELQCDHITKDYVHTVWKGARSEPVLLSPSKG